MADPVRLRGRRQPVYVGQRISARPARHLCLALAFLLLCVAAFASFATYGVLIWTTIFFQRTPDGVHMTGSVSGLFPFREHGVHIHTYGDAMPEGQPFSVGPIFNPGRKAHGCDGLERKAGDLVS